MHKDIRYVSEIELRNQEEIRYGNRSWFDVTRDEWLRDRRINPWRYESCMGAYFGMFTSIIVAVITVIVIVVNSYSLTTGPISALTICFVIAAACRLWVAQLRQKEKARIAAIPAAERDWKEQLDQFVPRIERFNKRLRAFKVYAENAEPGPGLDQAVVEKYSAEYDELTRLMRKIKRDYALTEFEAAAQNDQDGFRETRNLADAIFMNKVRIEEAGVDVRIADASPNEAQFLELDAAESAAAKK